MSQTKSKQRIRDLGEVFTAEREVNAMLDLIPVEQYRNPLSTWLEPACGNGNFLVAILARKLAHRPDNMPADIHALQAISTLYGVDIAPDNIEEAKARLLALLATITTTDENERFLAHARAILDTNIIIGNTLQPETVTIQQYIWQGTSYTARTMSLADCIEG
ncbi:hypothetical protein AWB71_05252 [Caballeronia peredens]|nr:hypothetical protein AWB71_05252 [Caballeronia peredens]